MKDCIGRCVRYGYDGDLLTSVEMVNGGVETYQYDAEGRVIEITDAGGNTYVHNEYDAGNRVTRQRLLGGQEYILLYADDDRTNTYLAPANGKQIRYIYNKKEQLIRTEYPDQTTEEYAYDDWENRIMEKGWAMRHAASMMNPAIFWRSISRMDWSAPMSTIRKATVSEAGITEGGGAAMFMINAATLQKKSSRSRTPYSGKYPMNMTSMGG